MNLLHCGCWLCSFCSVSPSFAVTYRSHVSNCRDYLMLECCFSYVQGCFVQNKSCWRLVNVLHGCVIFRTELTVSLKFQYSAECKSIDCYNVCVCMCSGMHGGLGPTPNCLCGPIHAPDLRFLPRGTTTTPVRDCASLLEVCARHCVFVCVRVRVRVRVRVCVCVCVCVSAVKQLITINRIQNKSFCLHNICVCTVYIYYVYINTHTHTHTVNV